MWNYGTPTSCRIWILKEVVILKSNKFMAILKQAPLNNAVDTNVSGHAAGVLSQRKTSALKERRVQPRR